MSYRLSQHDPFYVGGLFDPEGTYTPQPFKGWDGGSSNILNFDLPITEDGVYTITVVAGEEYYIEAYGLFGGGTLQLITDNDTVIREFTENGAYAYNATTSTMKLVLTGATAPNIGIEHNLTK